MYVISPITVLDNDKELFETHIGLDNEAKTLLLSAWGRSEQESRMCAENIIKIITAFRNELGYSKHDLINVLVGFMAAGCPNTKELRYNKWFEKWILKYDTTGEIYPGKFKLRRYPLTMEECTQFPIIGEGAESAEEL